MDLIVVIKQKYDKGHLVVATDNISYRLQIRSVETQEKGKEEETIYTQIQVALGRFLQYLATVVHYNL